MSKAINIKYHSDTDKLCNIGGNKSNWIDLRAAEEVFIPEGDFKMISLGVSMQLPEGYEAHVVPRSSTFKNYGIIMTNSMGIIDNSYNGTNDIWRFPAYCLKGNTLRNGKLGAWIQKGDRICQFRIVKIQTDILFKEKEYLNEEDRGGFGSTGTN